MRAREAKYDLNGQRFGRLLVLGSKRDPTPPHHLKWQCKCDCGQERLLPSANLMRADRQRATRSCGCLSQQTAREMGFRQGPKNKLAPGVAVLNDLINRYKAQAAARGFSWQLGRDEARILFTANCFYCGAQPSGCWRPDKFPETNGFLYNGIDRLENSKGYVIGNVVTCCIMCNRAKGSYSLQEFLCWIARLTVHRAAAPELSQAPKLFLEAEKLLSETMRK